MKTRFDENEIRTAANNEVLAIKDMSTAHLMNTASMFVHRPDRTITMLIADVESGIYEDHVWRSKVVRDDSVKQSIRNITSMTADEAVAYALNSPLGRAISAELEARGVVMDSFLRIRDGMMIRSVME